MSARSQLVRAERRTAGAFGTLVVLHADGEDAARGLELALAVAPAGCACVAAQAPRARDPFHASAAPAADPRWQAYRGYSWFRRDAAGRPEPASFGDSLAQLESLAHELRTRGGAPLWLLGSSEGATLALGAALAFPERLDAVVAQGGSWPEIPGWSEGRGVPVDLPLLRIGSDYTDPCGAADRVRAFLDARREGARHGRSRSQEAGQDVLQAHRHG